MKPQVYFFDGQWWVSRDGQLRPLGMTAGTREEALAVAEVLQTSGE